MHHTLVFWNVIFSLPLKDIFQFPLKFFCWTYLKVYCLISKYLGGISTYFTIDFQPSFSVVKEHILNDFNPLKLVEISFMASINVPCVLGKKTLFLAQCSVHISVSHGLMLLFNLMLTLLVCSCFLWFSLREVCECLLLSMSIAYISLKLCRFLFHIFWNVASQQVYRTHTVSFVPISMNVLQNPCILVLTNLDFCMSSWGMSLFNLHCASCFWFVWLSGELLIAVSWTSFYHVLCLFYILTFRVCH